MILEKSYFLPSENPWDSARNSLDSFTESIRISDDTLIYAVIGDWGSGKSTYLNYIAMGLQKGDSPCATLFFEPVRYKTSEELELSLFYNICDSIDLRGKDASRLAVTFFLSAGLNMREIFFNPDIPNKPDCLLSALLDSYLNPADYRETKSTLEKMISDSLEKKQQKKLIVIIDGLEHCDPERVIDLTDSLKVMFSLKHVSYVIALNESMVNTGLERRYGTSDSIKSDTYLMKATDFSLGVTEPLQHEVSLLFDEISSRTGIEMNDREKHLAIDFLYNIISFRNPRNLKKIIPLLLHYRRKFVELSYSPSLEYGNLLLLKVIIIREFSPSFFAFLRRNNPDGWFYTWKHVKGSLSLAEYSNIYGTKINEIINNELISLLFKKDCYRFKELKLNVDEMRDYEHNKENFSLIIMNLISIVSTQW